MDNQDLNIGSILSAIKDETVPFGFERKVFEKIQKEAAARESRRETLRNYIILIIFTVIFSGALLIINHYYLKIDFTFKPDFSFFAEKFRSLSGLFTSSESLLWIGIGTNIALLLLCERIISDRLSKRDTQKS